MAVKVRLQSVGSVWALTSRISRCATIGDCFPSSGRMAALRHAYRDHLIAAWHLVNAHTGNREFLSAAHTEEDLGPRRRRDEPLLRGTERSSR